MQRVYIAGAGYIAKQHASATEHLPEDVAVKAADPNPDARDSFADEFPDAELYEDAREMIDEPARESDIFVVATPPFVRRDLAVEGFESGRHVLCEKPLAMNRDEAADILAAARRNDRLLGTATVRHVAFPDSRAVRQLIRDGELGRPYHVSFVDRSRRTRTGIEYQPESRWPLDRSKSGGGILMNWGNYDFGTLNYVLEPAEVTVDHAWTATPETDHDLPDDVTYDVEQHAGAAMRYRARGEEIAVQYERSDCTHGEPRAFFEIEGTEGAVRWNWKDFEDPVSLTFQYDEGNEPREEERTYEVDDLPSGARPVVFFDRRIRGESAPIAINEQAAFNFACIRSIYEVADTGDPTTVVRSEL